ncbi:MAG: hypothetical protein ACNA71_10820 [Kiritimatiellia bacterium]
MIGLSRRFDLMRKAFAHTAAYDAAISAYFGNVQEPHMRACYNLEA